MADDFLTDGPRGWDDGEPDYVRCWCSTGCPHPFAPGEFCPDRPTPAARQEGDL